MTADVLDLVAADVSAAASRRAANRARWPELAAAMDSLPGARMVCVYGEDGSVLAGKPPPADPASWAVLSGDCVVALSAWGRK